MGKHLSYILDSRLLSFVFPNYVFRIWDMFPSSGIMVLPLLRPSATPKSLDWMTETSGSRNVVFPTKKAVDGVIFVVRRHCHRCLGLV